MDFGMLTLAFWIGIGLMALNVVMKSILVGIASVCCFLYAYYELSAINEGWFQAAPMVLAVGVILMMVRNLIRGGIE